MTRGMRFAVTMVALALWAAVTVAAAAAPGDLDPSFGAGGKALVNLGGDDSAAAVALQPDGAILVAGSSQVGADPSVAVVARLLNPRGALDPSYGGGSGWSKMDFLNGGDRANAIALQPDGRILVAGSSEDATGPNPAGVVARLRNPEGTLDGTYGGGSGWSRIDLDGEETLNTIALQPDGAIVAGGRTSVGSTGDATVVRLRNPEGTFDSSYGGGSGWSRLALGGLGESDAIALQPDGRIVVVGTLSPLVGADLTVSRLVNPQGTFDPTFGAGTGVVVVNVNQYDLGAALALQPDGKILVAATTGGMSPGSHAVLVMRFLPDGGPDPAFGTGGRALLEAAGGADASAMVLQPDGKILLAGADFTAARNAFVRRLQPNGSPDTTFASGGRATLDFGGNDNASSLALQPDGAIVVAGSTTANGGEIAVARLQGDPRPPAGAAPLPGRGGPGASAPPRCGGRAATIIGTAARNTLRGTPRADVIVGLGGNDRIVGAGGADVICGGPGNDVLSGGAGSDRLLGEAGADRLAGEAGADRLLGGVGADRLAGGAGADRLEGGAGADRLLGGAGIDRLLGGPGADVLRGGVGKDVLNGGPGRNVQAQ